MERFKIERRSTHSDLAKLLLDHADRLLKLPPQHLMGDASTVDMIRGAALALVLLDDADEQKTLALRACYAAGYKESVPGLR